MAEKSARDLRGTVRRVLIHAAGCLLTFFTLNALSLVAPSYELATLLAVLSLVAYPIVACVYYIVRSFADYRAGLTVAIPLPARILFNLLVVMGVASSDSASDAMLKGVAIERGLHAGRSYGLSRRSALVARVAVLTAFLAVCCELLAIFLSVGTPLFDAMCWVTLGTVAAFCMAMPIAYLAHFLIGVKRERGEKRASAGWSLDARTAAAVERGDAIVFSRNEEKRRPYVAFARNVTLGMIATGLATLGVVVLVPEGPRFAFFDAFPLVHGLVSGVIGLGVFAWPIAAGWWAHRSGTSLTQTIVLENGRLSYALTSGSGELASTSTWNLDGVTGYELGRWCIKVNGHGATPHGEKGYHLDIPRTFDGEERFLRELDLRVARNRRA